MLLINFYRPKDWIKNTGIVVLGYLSSQNIEHDLFFPIILCFCLMAFAFSLNDFYDKKRGEKNIQNILESKYGKKTIIFLILLPLIVSFVLSSLLSLYLLFLCLAFALIFFIYSFPSGFKQKWFLSLPACVVGLGAIPFFMGLGTPGFSTRPSVPVVFFSVMVHMLICEILHQISDMKQDEEHGIESFPLRFGYKKTKILLGSLVLLGLLINILSYQLNRLFLLVGILWSFRLLFISLSDQESIKSFRRRFSGMPDGLLYLIILF